ncbi:hypothetical protein [Streptacidiphilus carbonis]|uniref:hypothetical protein n=1 Tax=Streptacidiphilus carbonis TaxID=105422 RepID=UPI0006943CCC|nr:hypothetical protein [Streptacidiphilus carbonis]
MPDLDAAITYGPGGVRCGCGRDAHSNLSPCQEGPTMSDIQNPTGLSDYDWLEFVAFVWKVENEGYEYAAENYSPDFEDTGLPVDGDDLRDLYHRYFDAVEIWAETVGTQEAVDLHNNHVDEARQRRDDACLWGARAQNGNVLTCKSRQGAEFFVKDPSWACVALLHRDVPGGEWTEVADDA